MQKKSGVNQIVNNLQSSFFCWIDNKNIPPAWPRDGKFSKKFGEGWFVIPTPIEVDSLMKKVPKGRLTTINALRTALSKMHQTDFACPITTGIFSWIAAHAADE